MKLRLVKQGEFMGIKCDFWLDEETNEIFMTREQIGSALKFADPNQAVLNIHARNKDRLDPLSRSLKLRGVDGRQREHVAYTPRGIYEVCRYTRQPNADDFIDWTWDIVEAIRTGRITQQVLRQAGITIRRTLTDSIRDLIEESPHKKFQYKNYTDLIYKQLFGMNAKEIRLHLGLSKEENIRDFLDANELEAVLQAERQVSTLIEMKLSYHDIKGIFSKKQVVRSLPRGNRPRKTEEEAN